MTQQIDKILEELYTLDPKLKNKEKELVKIVEKLLTAKPEVKIDEAFVTNLRRELLNREIKVRPSLSSFFLFMKKKPVYITGSIFAVLVLIVGLGYFNFYNNQNLTFKDFGEESIVSTKSGAFGSLSGIFQPQVENGERSATTQALGIGGGGGLATPTAMDAMIASDGVAEKSSIGIVAPDYFNQYQFKYTGGDFQIDAEELPVFKRIKGHPASTGLVSAIYSQVKSMINLSSLNNMEVESIRMTQTVDNGYGVTLSLTEGSVNIENIDRREYAVLEKASDPYRQLTADEMPKDEEIIAVSNNFLNKFGINRDNYGAPYINKSWEETILYYGTPGSDTRYIPSVISVVYPISIEGNDTYDQGGEKRGLQVNVNVNKMSVQNLWNLTTEKYESSNYAITRDYEKIKKLAEQGGAYPNYYNENAKIVTLNLGQPELVYVLQYRYNGDEASSDELYIPAFKFPILNAPEGYYGRQTIIIPVVKEILDEYGNIDGGIKPMPEPMILEGATSGSSGSGVNSVDGVEVEPAREE